MSNLKELKNEMTSIQTVRLEMMSQVIAKRTSEQYAEVKEKVLVKEAEIYVDYIMNGIPVKIEEKPE